MDPDPARPTPKGAKRRLSQLADAGIPAGAVRILVATGSHGSPHPQALAAKVGPEAAAACDLLVHDYARGLARVGRSSFATPVLVNQEVLASDLVIGIGGIYPQHSTGFGGGAKLALGVLGKRSIVALHYRHPSMAGAYEVDNDFRRDLDGIATMIGLRTSVSVHVDTDRRPVRVTCGDHRRYYEEAVGFSQRAYRAPRPTDADVVIANAYPIDVSLTFMRSKGLIPLLLGRARRGCWCRPAARGSATTGCSRSSTRRPGSARCTWPARWRPSRARSHPGSPGGCGRPWTAAGVAGRPRPPPSTRSGSTPLVATRPTCPPRSPG
jgi:hypothetical protein